MRLSDLAKARVAIWGYGREGRAAMATIRRRFPQKPLTVFCNVDEAKDLPSSGTPCDVVTVAPTASDLSQFDVVIKSPGISAHRTPVPEATRSGVRFTSGTALWFAENPSARTICVTGTKGKSTVAALIAHILRKSGKCIALAGNIGLPLLELLDPPRVPDWWVIELSSFQTRDLKELGNDAVTVGVVNNVYEEHLDWHGSRQQYVDDKLMLASGSKSLVLNAAQDDLLRRFQNRSGVVRFGDKQGWHVRDDAIWRAAERLLPIAEILLPGLHNAQNVCAAMAAIETALPPAEFDARSLVAHVRTFKPLPHRLQYLGERAGLHYINDSISTTPYATIEALRSLDGKSVTVLVGGFDRGVSWVPFAEYVAQHPPQTVVAMGANGEAIALALGPTHRFAIERETTLADAVARAVDRTPPGGTILLSPGAPSFDQFRDYAERGREFARLAGFDPKAIAQIEGLGIA